MRQPHRFESRSAEARARYGIISRCTNPLDQDWEHYGGRGIRVCQRWLESYANFLEDMGRRPEDCTSIDRIDNDGDYCKENCRWADDITQRNNMSSNVILSFMGESLTISQWGSKLGVPGKMLAARRRMGWTVDRILTTPYMYSPRSPLITIELNGVRLSAREWAERTGLKAGTITSRSRKGWSPEQILDAKLHPPFKRHP